MFKKLFSRKKKSHIIRNPKTSDLTQIDLTLWASIRASAFIGDE